jgi:hypothetical protein
MDLGNGGLIHGCDVTGKELLTYHEALQALYIWSADPPLILASDMHGVKRVGL